MKIKRPKKALVKDPLGGCKQQPGSDLLFDCTTRNFPDVYTCRKCKFRAYLYVNLKTHIEMIHKLKENTPMDKISEICDKHYNLAKILQVYKCDNCDFSTYSALVMLRHSHVHQTKKFHKSEAHTTNKSHQQKLSSYDCELCPYKTCMRSLLTHHIDTKHSEYPEWFVCERCSYKTIFPANLEKHYVAVHPPKQVFHCEFCSYITDKKSRFTIHLLNRHAKDEDVKWFQCEHCPHKTKYKNDLQKHEQAVHWDSSLIDWLLCELCGFKTKKLYNLKEHVRHVHLKEREVFLCEVCAHTNSTKGQLTQHMKKKHGTC